MGSVEKDLDSVWQTEDVREPEEVDSDVVDKSVC
jgi:hypothetical protein